jgi:hypothetical protein
MDAAAPAVERRPAHLQTILTDLLLAVITEHEQSDSIVTGSASNTM